MVAVPGGTEKLVAESQNEDVLDHLLAQIVVDSEDLVLGPVGCQRLLQLSRTAQVLSEWLLDLHWPY